MIITRPMALREEFCEGYYKPGMNGIYAGMMEMFGYSDTLRTSLSVSYTRASEEIPMDLKMNLKM